MPSVCDARVNSQRTGRHIVIALATLTVFAISTGSVHAQAEKTRPRIALALGGGAARGIAHVGVLQWLEEHRIPVDVVVGTSMGGLIGGAYASGMSPAEIRTFLATTDWDLIFLGETPYQHRDLRRREDRRIYPMRVEFGLKGGFKLPPGLDNGQQVTFLLQRIALPYYAVSSFDELPTPFRCVATDMEKGEPVVLGSGSLARAMRATMSLPTAFAPIVIDGRLLADGGILNNVPVDVARAQGADVVIAVNVGSTPHTREQMMSLFGMLGQTLDVAMSDSSRAIAATADVLVQPAVGGIGSLDFRRSDEIADLGYQGASQVTALLKYAVDDATWSQWVKARAARRKIDPPVPEFARIVGVGDKVDTTEMAEGLERFFGKPLDQEALGQALTRITGDGLYSAVTYDAIRENGRDGLLVHVDEKLTGPPLLNVALEVSNRASKGLSFDPAFRVTMFNTLTKNSELRLDGSAGTRLGVSAEYYQRFGLSRYFLAPSIGAERRITEYFVNGESLAEYQARIQRWRGCGRAAEPRRRASCRLHLRTRRSRAWNRFGNSSGVWRTGAPHAHSASPRQPDEPVCADRRPAGRRRVLVLGSQSDPGGRLQPARGPSVAVLHRAQQGSCVRAVRRRDVVWHVSAGSLQVHARRTVPTVRLRER